jgi:NTE family protein
VMIQANEELQLRTLTERDIRIDVPVGDIGTSDFERIPEAIPLGEAAARQAAERLAELALPVAEYAAWRDGVTADQAFEAHLADVRFEGLERVNPEYLAQRAVLRAGDTVDTAAISAEAQRMSALQELESVEYRLEGDPRRPTLVWLPQEKRWGPDYLKFDLGMYASEGGDLFFTIYAKYFVEPRVGWWRTVEGVFENGDRLASYQFNNYGGGVDFGVNLSNRAQARLGYLYTRRDVEVDSGSPLLPEETSDDAGLVVSATYDSRDTPFNATHGMALALEYLQSDETLGASRDWQRIEAGAGIALPVRKDVIWLNLAGGANLGSDLPWDRTFMIGGPGSFPGYELSEIRAEDYWIAAGSYLWQIKEIMSIRGQALYAGVRVQAGETLRRLDEVDDNRIYGSSIYLTGRTPVGPLTLGVGATSTDSWSMWLAVGRPVGHGTILERGIFR